MSKYFKISICLLVLSIISWCLQIFIYSADFELVLAICSITLSILFICFSIIAIGNKISQKVSPYKIFAIVTAILGVCTTIYAIYDIKTDTGWFAGLLGFLLLVIVVPIIFALQLIALIVWLYKRKKK